MCASHEAPVCDSNFVIKILRFIAFTFADKSSIILSLVWKGWYDWNITFTVNIDLGW